MKGADYDIVIIGGGIVGLASAFEILKKDPGLKIILLEKENRMSNVERIEALEVAAQACEVALNWPAALVTLALIALVGYIFHLMTG